MRFGADQERKLSAVRARLHRRLIAAEGYRAHRVFHGDNRADRFVPAVLHRRQLHRLQASKGGIRKPYGGTRSLGIKRGTVVWHQKYGLSAIGGFDRQKQTVSLHDYRTNKRLTQKAKVEACRILTWVAFRSFLVAEKKRR